MWECKHCKKNFDFNNTSEKANHSRWCDSNPDKKTEKVLTALKKRHDEKYGKILKFTVLCNCCEKNFDVEERENLFPSKEKYFCSRKCANSVGGKAKRDKYGLSAYTSIAKQYYAEKCIVCGFDEIVEVHHIDENRNNNDKKNLVFLCPNHHYLLHRKKSDKVGNTIKKFIKETWG